MKKILINLIVVVGMLVSLLAFSGGAPAHADGSSLTFSPTPVVFHNQLVPTQEALHAVTVTLTNSTSSTLDLGYFRFIDGSDFQIPTNNCVSGGVGLTLQPNGLTGDSCNMVLQFYPQSVGIINSQLLVYAPDGITILGTLNLSGTGLAGTELTKNGLFSTGAKVPAYWAKIGTWSASDGKLCGAIFVSPHCALHFVQGLNIKPKGISFTVSKAGVAGSAFYFSVWSKGISVPTMTAANATILLYHGAKVYTFPSPISYVGTYGFAKSSTWFIAPVSYTKVVVKLYYTAKSGMLWYDNASLLWAP
jgi:hypothetical protein